MCRFDVKSSIRMKMKKIVDQNILWAKKQNQ